MLGFKRLAVLAAAGVMLGVGSVNATPVPVAPSLAYYINTGAILKDGDKDFTFQGYSATGDMPTADLINVVAHQDADGNYGIELQGAFNDNPGGGASDALIHYTVTVDPSAPSWYITDAHMTSNLLIVPHPSENAHGTIDETFAPDSNKMLVNFVPGKGGLKDQVKFALKKGYKTLHVTKDILLDAGPTTELNKNGKVVSNGPLTLSFIDQSFSQTAVPLPAAAWGGMSLLGVLGIARKMKK